MLAVYCSLDYIILFFKYIYVFIYLFMLIAVSEESYENHFVFWYAYLEWIRYVNFTWAIVKPNSNKVNKEGFKADWKIILSPISIKTMW